MEHRRLPGAVAGGRGGRGRRMGSPKGGNQREWMKRRARLVNGPETAQRLAWMGEDLSESVFKIHISIRYICIYLYIFYDLFLWHLAPFPRRKSNCRPNWPEFRFGLGLFFQRRLLPRPRYISSSPHPLTSCAPLLLTSFPLRIPWRSRHRKRKRITRSTRVMWSHMFFGSQPFENIEPRPHLWKFQSERWV